MQLSTHEGKKKKNQRTLFLASVAAYKIKCYTYTTQTLCLYFCFFNLESYSSTTNGTPLLVDQDTNGCTCWRNKQKLLDCKQQETSSLFLLKKPHINTEPPCLPTRLPPVPPPQQHPSKGEALTFCIKFSTLFCSPHHLNLIVTNL